MISFIQADFAKHAHVVFVIFCFALFAPLPPTIRVIGGWGHYVIPEPNNPAFPSAQLGPCVILTSLAFVLHFTLHLVQGLFSQTSLAYI